MEFKTTKDFIMQAHKSACTEWKLKIEKEFPDAFKKEFKVGKWYKIGDNPNYILNFQSEEKSYGFCDGHWLNDYVFEDYHKSIAVEATDKEVEEALIEEAKKRFGEDWENAKVKKCLCHGNGVYKNSKSFIVVVNVCYNKIWNRNALIFKNGIWAEPLIEEKTTISKVKALKIIAKKLKVSPKNIIIE